MRFQSRWLVLAFLLHQVILDTSFVSAENSTWVIEGVVEVRVADDFTRKRAWEILLLHDATSGKTYRLEFPEGRPRSLRSGDRVRLTGVLEGDVLAVQRLAALPSPTGPGTEKEGPAAVSGGLRSVVLIVNLADSVVSCTASQIASTMYGGPSSVDGLFREMSFGLVSFPGDTNQDAQPDVFGPFLVPGSKSSCDSDAWANAADAAAQSAGVNLDLYGFKMYVIPSDTTCPWGGLGYVGNEAQITPTSCAGGFLQCRSWNAFCESASIFAHELGHNIGMLHASGDLDNDGYVDPGMEYGDYSDVMGCCGLLHANGPHKVEMGWSSPVTVSGSGTFSLAPLEALPASPSLPQVLKVRNLYYLSYRRPTGYDSTLIPPYSNATNVHRQKYFYEFSFSPPFDLVAGRGLGNSLWVAGLDDGEVFQDVQNGVTIRQLSHSANQATVEVRLDVPPGRKFHTITPCRWFDTRSTFLNAWPLYSGEERIFRVAGRCGIPVTARALAVNITVTEPSGGGYLLFYPADVGGTSTSTINFSAGQTRANNAVLPLSPDGYQTLGVVSRMNESDRVHLIIDITGYFE